MGIKDIDISTLATVINEQSDGFTTRDISEDPRMLKRNALVKNERNYHANVGRRISMENGRGGIPALHKGASSRRGQRWHFSVDLDVVVAESRAESQHVDAHVEISSEHRGLGPQSSSDTPFRSAMRLFQSRYRRDVLRVPCGTGPYPSSTSHYGNMLTAADGERGANFLSPEIFEVVKARLGQGKDRVEPFRLKHNMLSSQPMCFNLFGPLVRDHEMARRLVIPLIGEVARVTEVRIEYSPEPAAEYLSDRTSFDAFISYERPDGAHGFIGIETKYTEPFSQRRDDKPSYRRWMSAKAPWREEAASSVADIAHNQLWRDHLLAVAMRDHYRSEYAEGHLMLVRHPGDASCARIVENYKTLLRDGDKTFIDMPLDELLRQWEGACEAGEVDWLARFRDRYLPDSV